MYVTKRVVKGVIPEWFPRSGTSRLRGRMFIVDEFGEVGVPIMIPYTDVLEETCFDTIVSAFHFVGRTATKVAQTVGFC